jgi:hypothetical protein
VLENRKLETQTPLKQEEYRQIKSDFKKTITMWYHNKKNIR